ncbi:MAG: DUF4159 domain-containing protein [Verrucomicrobia bacterium]|nr:DUF4159 domain-containing protein [Verrucomicrobiota bacterium]MCH8513269.1 DUF4159 domain-containing protein [Kiritimatiellia bacterium]
MKRYLLLFLSLGCLHFLGMAESLDTPLAVSCANLIYGSDGKTFRCFHNGFLKEIEKHANIVVEKEFVMVPSETPELFRHPFAIMSGEGSFTLTDPQRTNLRRYLEGGGFLVASAGCSSRSWGQSFLREFKELFPERELVKLEPEHPIFHTVHDVGVSAYRSGGSRFPELYGLEIDGRIVLVYSPEGLNDTANMNKDAGCCCCGGNEIRTANSINMNLLAFALTH